MDDAGFFDARKLFNVIRLLGYNPTEAEVQDLIAAGDKDGIGLYEFIKFSLFFIRLKSLRNINRREASYR